MHTLEEV